MVTGSVRKRVSDVLAWLAFAALLFSLVSFVVPLVEVSGVVGQVLETYEEVSDCGSQRCEATLNIEGLPERSGWLGAVQGFLAEWRSESFLLWLGIGIFQTFFIRAFRFLPWRPVVVRVVTRVPLDEVG